MLEGQTNIFEMIYPTYKINKPIRLIEFFAGYGSQALALKYLGVPFEHWKICEWAIKSIQAYKDIHFTDINVDFSGDLTKENLVKVLYELGISSNYNEPMTKQQIERLNEKTLKTIWNNIVITKNLVNIQQVNGKDLEIVDTDKYDYILTYSFPCQDLSLAGKGKGMSDTSTRSGMLWEVERILTECYELGALPKVLLMENVPQVHGVDNIEDFNKWQLRLEQLGYKNYCQDLIATDYGIPQTRNRCFMISILGDYNYTFPKAMPLKLKLKDLLEDDVDEKYYLSDKMKQYIFSEDDKYKVNKNSLKLNRDIACSKTTREGWTRADTSDYICEVGNKSLQETLEKNNIDDTCYIDTYNKRIDKDKSGTITTGVSFRNNTFLAVKEETLKKDLCNKLIEEGLVEEGDVVKHSYTSQILDGNKKCVEKNDGNMITLTTRGDCVGVCVGTYQYAKSDTFMQGKDRLQLGKEVSDTLQTTQKEGIVNSNLRIRKLTPKECFRLMGVKDEDFDKVAKNQSDSSLYHLAGDSIVVNVLMAIFKELL